jgi:hypothetical protein
MQGDVDMDGFDIEDAGDIDADSVSLPNAGPLVLSSGKRVVVSDYASTFTSGRRSRRFVATTNQLYVYDGTDISLFRTNSSFVVIEDGSLVGEMYRVSSVDTCATNDVPFAGISVGETYLTCAYSGAAQADQAATVAHGFVAGRIAMSAYYYGIFGRYDIAVRNKSGGYCYAISGTFSANAGVGSGLPEDYTHTGIDVADAYGMDHAIVYAGGSTIEIVVWQTLGNSADVQASLDISGVGSIPTVSILPTN